MINDDALNKFKNIADNLTKDMNGFRESVVGDANKSMNVLPEGVQKTFLKESLSGTLDGSLTIDVFLKQIKTHL